MSRSNGLLRILTTRCEAASELSSRELDESLRAVDRAALWGHLLVCRSCRRFRRQIRVIREALRRRDRVPVGTGADDGALSEPARRRIARAIRQAAGNEVDGEDGAPD